MARKRQSPDERSRKREEILDGAMAVFEKHGGLAALSLRRLATEMSLSYSAPYRYFASKEELVTALRARAYRWIEGVMLEAIDGLPQPDRQLEALAAAYIRNGVERPHRYALMFFNLDDGGIARRSIEFRAAKHDALDVCTRVITAGQADGSLPAQIDPLTASHLFWIGAHGLVSLQVAGQFEMGRSFDALVPVLIQTLRTGMEHYAAANGRPSAIKAREENHG